MIRASYNTYFSIQPSRKESNSKIKNSWIVEFEGDYAFDTVGKYLCTYVSSSLSISKYLLHYQ